MMALLTRSGRLDGQLFLTGVGDHERFVFVTEGQHEATGCTVQGNGFNDAVGQKKQKERFE